MNNLNISTFYLSELGKDNYIGQKAAATMVSSTLPRVLSFPTASREEHHHVKMEKHIRAWLKSK